MNRSDRATVYEVTEVLETEVPCRGEARRVLAAAIARLRDLAEGRSA